jgi:hypothetical protein
VSCVNNDLARFHNFFDFFIRFFLNKKKMLSQNPLALKVSNNVLDAKVGGGKKKKGVVLFCL